jgi:hypothetical protein
MASDFKAGMLKQTILMTARMGTARSMPGMPHSQPQKIREKKTRSGLRPSPYPITLTSSSPRAC